MDTQPILHSVFLFHDSYCEAQIVMGDCSTTTIKLTELSLEGLSMDDRYAKIKDRVARYIQATSTILIPDIEKVSLMYRGNVYPAREIMYRDFGIESDPWKATLVSTEALNKIIMHDINCPIPSIEEDAKELDARVGFFLSVDYIENCADDLLLDALRSKYSDEFEFKAEDKK